MKEYIEVLQVVFLTSVTIAFVFGLFLLLRELWKALNDDH